MDILSSRAYSAPPRLPAQRSQRKSLSHHRVRSRQLEILVVEDNRGDADLLRAAFTEWHAEVRLSVVEDGEQALQYVYQKDRFTGAPVPDLIFLDLNLPRKNGMEVLAALKNDPNLQQIPVVVLSTSDSKEDVAAAYRLHANCYLTKTLDVNEFFAKIGALEEFWLGSVRLPSDDH
jgi:chemotaxis family two-component system response regulator Rcp1